MAIRGEIIDGKYEVLREIGRGGMSVVYLAMDKRLNKQWAIKEFRKDKNDADNEAALKALIAEANLMKKLDHPTLPRIVDIIETNDTVYVVMDYIEGESLNRVLDEYGAQPQEAVIEWAKQLSLVLDYLHTQTPAVIYRDMKPANIMLKPDGSVRLIDFGIAREYKEGHEGDTMNLGTKGYAAPEQFGGRGQTDARTDIYSFGVTLYHLVTGKNPSEPPFEIYPIRHWNPSLSSGLEWLISKCTQLNPDDRFQSCAEVTYVLENLEKFEGEYRKTQKSRINMFLVAAIMAVVFIIAGISCFIGAESLKNNTYDSFMQQDTYTGYQQAIEMEPGRPDAYLEMLDKMSMEIKNVYVDMPEDQEFSSSAMELSEINRVFSDRTSGMVQIREENPVEFARINYYAGKLIWNTYTASENVSDEQMYSEVFKYFKNVMSMTPVILQLDDQDVRNREYAGLEPQEYNLARCYYLISFFSVNKKNMVANEDGGLRVSDEARYAGVQGINDSGRMENPYYSFWITMENAISLIGGTEDISEYVELIMLRRMSYLLTENYSLFYTKTQNKADKVDGERMKEFYIKCSDILKAEIYSSDPTLKEIRDSAVANLNAILPMVETEYEIELDEIKVEEVE